MQKRQRGLLNTLDVVPAKSYTLPSGGGVFRRVTSYLAGIIPSSLKRLASTLSVMCAISSLKAQLWSTFYIWRKDMEGKRWKD